jgi:flagellar protein FliT
MIRPSLSQWQIATNSLLNVLDQRHEDQRDSTIEVVEKLLTEREQLQPSIQPPFTKEEHEFGKELIFLEKELQIKLALLSKDIRLDITGHQKKMDSSNAYMDPYSQVFRDGTFYDKKK